MEYLEDISSETTLKSFPAKYNADNKALVDEINRLNDIITAKNAEIQKIKRDFSDALNVLRSELKAEYTQMFNQLNN